MSSNLPIVNEVESAIGRLADQLTMVGTELVSISAVRGRILSEPLLADRDSPSIDVSAMDGYAVRIQDISDQPLVVSFTSAAGAAPGHLPIGAAVRIFTGAPVPKAAEVVIAREQTTEFPDRVVIHQPRDAVVSGQHIRRQGENIAAGCVVLDAGCEITASAMSAVATFAPPLVSVYKKVRVAVVNTGDELVMPGANDEAWQIRDSNGPLLEAWLSSMPWVELVARTRVADDFEQVRKHLADQLEKCDAIIVTGGMSAGDTDHVPLAVSSLGGVQVFHRLGIRPGKPVFGAHLGNKLVLGLPGNPVSVAVTSRVFGTPLLAYIGGKLAMPPSPWVELADADNKSLHLTWYRLVDITPSGVVRLISNQGSGDVVGLARSGGFVTLPPGASGAGPWRLTCW